ncbi:hypothetical protein [Reyranella sp.]|uniref:hypothetical protein n=1 Tax=Reyranella sp. TaxID=1929291 RepID=UPI003BA8A483
MRNRFALAALLSLLPAVAGAQSAGEVERCFQNPAACHQGNAAPSAASAPRAPAAAAPRPAAPDYGSVLQSPEAERKRIQQSLRTLDKYSGPMDGNLESGATVKAIQDWQKGHGANPVGKLTPAEAQQLHAEAAKVPIKRIEPPAQTAAVTPTPLSSPKPDANAEALKALQARLAERRKAAEPKAEAASQALVRDLKAYIAADGKGAAGEQFAGFAKWYADAKASGRTVGDILPAVDDYGDVKAGAAVATEVTIATAKDKDSQPECMVFAWVEGKPRKNARTFSCDDVAGVEKWKTEQSMKSAWR